jgi:hypothetical protein
MTDKEKTAAKPNRKATKSKLSLISKLAEVQASISNVAKDGYNEFHKYKYAEEAAIVKACRWELATRHIMIVPSVESVDRTGTLTTITTSYTIYDGESGETITSRWAGTGDDKGDKGLYKANTGSLKTYLCKLLLLPTGDDAEQDSPVSNVKVDPHLEDAYGAWLKALTLIAEHPTATEQTLVKAIKKDHETYGSQFRARLHTSPDAWKALKATLSRKQA